MAHTYLPLGLKALGSMVNLPTEMPKITVDEGSTISSTIGIILHVHNLVVDRGGTALHQSCSTITFANVTH